jgi:hypothetical protein
LSQQRAQQQQQLLIVAAAAMESRSRKAPMTFPKAFPPKTLQTVTSTQLFLQIIQTFPIKSSRSQTQVVVVVANCGYLLTYLLLLDFIFFIFILFLFFLGRFVRRV